MRMKYPAVVPRGMLDISGNESAKHQENRKKNTRGNGVQGLEDSGKPVNRKEQEYTLESGESTCQGLSSLEATGW
jgi:hypothetical protein